MEQALRSSFHVWYEWQGTAVVGLYNQEVICLVHVQFR